MKYKNYELVKYKRKTAQIIKVNNGWVVLIIGGKWYVELDDNKFSKI